MNTLDTRDKIDGIRRQMQLAALAVRGLQKVDPGTDAIEELLYATADALDEVDEAVHPEPDGGNEGVDEDAPWKAFDPVNPVDWCTAHLGRAMREALNGLPAGQQAELFTRLRAELDHTEKQWAP